MFCKLTCLLISVMLFQKKIERLQYMIILLLFHKELWTNTKIKCLTSVVSLLFCVTNSIKYIFSLTPFKFPFLKAHIVNQHRTTESLQRPLPLAQTFLICFISVMLTTREFFSKQSSFTPFHFWRGESFGAFAWVSNGGCKCTKFPRELHALSNDVLMR